MKRRIKAANITTQHCPNCNHEHCGKCLSKTWKHKIGPGEYGTCEREHRGETEDGSRFVFNDKAFRAEIDLYCCACGKKNAARHWIERSKPGPSGTDADKQTSFI